MTTPELTIRGLDRNEVILDGEFELDNGIRVLGAGGVAVENMTARNYTFNGFFWTGVDGYRGSYLTAYRNGDYGRLRLRLGERPVRALLRRREPRCRRLHRPVLPVRRRDRRRPRRVQRARLLRHQLGRQPAHRQLAVQQQPGRHRAQLGQLRAVLPAARDDDRRQPRLLQQPGRHPGHRRSRSLAMGNGILVSGGVAQHDLAQPRLGPRRAPASASLRSPRSRPSTTSPSAGASGTHRAPRRRTTR